LPNGPLDASTSPTFSSVGLLLVLVTDGMAFKLSAKSALGLTNRSV